MDLLTRTRTINESRIEVLVAWADLFKTIESAKFKVTKLEHGFQIELIGGTTDTVTMVGPGTIVVTTEPD